MFGCIVAGRLVQTNLQTVDTGRYLFILDNPTSINHIVIFLTGERPFELGYGATVYFNTDAGEATGNPWKYLGILTNEKPSAVFKLSTLTSDDAATQRISAIHIGLSIEPLYILQQLQSTTGESSSKAMIVSTNTTPVNPIHIAQRIGEHLINYLMSFTRTAYEVSQIDPNLQVVPVRVMQDWFNGMVRRATTDSDGFMRQFCRDRPLE